MRFGLILNILNEPYQISIFEGIKKRAKEAGIELICFQLENEKLSEFSLVSDLPHKDFFQLDGIMILTSVLTAGYEFNLKKDIEALWKDIPVISIGQHIAQVPSILIQTDHSMKQLVEHLILVHKYRKFLFISGPQNQHDATIRRNIFEQTLEAYKPWFSDLTYEIKFGFFTEGGATEVMRQYYSQDPVPEPDVIVCANDNMAIGVSKFFQVNAKNKKIKACAITGFDDIPQAKFTYPLLTTVKQPLLEIGERSVDYLTEVVQGHNISYEEFVESKVIFRNSCGCVNSKGISHQRRRVDALQVDYFTNEARLQVISGFMQDLNYRQSFDGLKYTVSVNLNYLNVDNFCILKFNNPGKDPKSEDSKLYVNPIYVRRDGKEIYDFFEVNNISIREFFNQYLSKGNPQDRNVMVLKFLWTGHALSGCVLYDCSKEILPHMRSITTSIGENINRINTLEEKKKQSEYLEKEVEKRTHELVEANNKRMEVEAEILQISEKERQRFSTDLHDDICQRLAGISMLCRSYARVASEEEKAHMEELAELVGETLQTTRQYAHNSYPVELESLGMNHAVSNLCSSFEKQHEIHCKYQWLLDENIKLTNIQKLNVFRIIQEALHNIAKHAKAKNVEVCVKSKGRTLIAQIADDGLGFDLKKLKSRAGLGLNSMQYRANQIGGSFKIRHNKPNGTIVEIKLELNLEDKQSME